MVFLYRPFQQTLIKRTHILQNIITSTLKIKIAEPSLTNNLFVSNNRIRSLLKSGFMNPYGGIHVIVSPHGSGKTTLVCKYANEVIENGGSVRYMGSEIESFDDYYNVFQNNTLPKNSTIIIDHLDNFKTLSKEIKSFISYIDLNNYYNINVIIPLSCPIMANLILNTKSFNNNIQQLGKSNDFQWDKAVIEQYAEKVCNNWSIADKEIFIELGIISKSPLFLCSIKNIYSTGLPTNKKSLYKSAAIYQNEFLS